MEVLQRHRQLLCKSRVVATCKWRMASQLEGQTPPVLPLPLPVLHSLQLLALRLLAMELLWILLSWRAFNSGQRRRLHDDSGRRRHDERATKRRGFWRRKRRQALLKVLVEKLPRQCTVRSGPPPWTRSRLCLGC